MNNALESHPHITKYAVVMVSVKDLMIASVVESGAVANVMNVLKDMSWFLMNVYQDVLLEKNA